MDPIRDRIVTLASLQSPGSKPAEAVEAVEQASDDEQVAAARLKQAEFEQIQLRLQRASEEVGEDVMITAQDRAVSMAQSWFAEQAELTAPKPGDALEVKFGTGVAGRDWLRWLWSLTDWVDRADAHPILRPADVVPRPLSGDIRMAIAADWGTGLYGAPRIASAMRGMAHDRKFDLLMHLGDVYYSGTRREVQERFLDVWPADAGVLNRALNGNHEMYSGGFGYFELMLPAFDQESSYFALQNDHWVLVGLDTAYVDHNVDAKQVAWLNLVLRQADLPRRKVVLFSHHQPFSRTERRAQGPKLQQALGHLLEDRLVTAWYWGHEHHCVIYDRHDAWGLHGRCLGNGGIPEVPKDEVRAAPRVPDRTVDDLSWRRLESNDDAPGCMVLDGPNAEIPGRGDDFVPHGFMTLEFTGAQLTERVFRSDGREIFVNPIG